MNQIIPIAESETSYAFLRALMCRKPKQEEVRALKLQAWTREEVAAQAGMFKAPVDEARAA